MNIIKMYLITLLKIVKFTIPKFIRNQYSDSNNELDRNDEKD